MKYYTYKITYKHLDYNITSSKIINWATSEKYALEQFYKKVCVGCTCENDVEIIKIELIQTLTR